MSKRRRSPAQDRLPEGAELVGAGYLDDLRRVLGAARHFRACNDEQSKAELFAILDEIELTHFTREVSATHFGHSPRRPNLHDLETHGMGHKYGN